VKCYEGDMYIVSRLIEAESEFSGPLRASEGVSPDLRFAADLQVLTIPPKAVTGKFPSVAFYR
jgi:hypothetical protein